MVDQQDNRLVLIELLAKTAQRSYLSEFVR